MDDPVAVVVQEAVVEIDDAADEARMEDADAAVVEQIDALRLAVFGEDGVVAEMRIAVDHGRVAEGMPPGLEHRDGEPVADLDRRFGIGQDLLALEPAEGEEPPRREVRMRP